MTNLDTTSLVADTEPQGPRSADGAELGKRNLEADYQKTLIETYRHHFDLFVKGWMLYFVVVGAVGGYLAKDGTNADIQRAAAIFIWILSLGGLERCQRLMRWVEGIETSMEVLARGLNFPPLSLSGAKAVIRTVQFGCITVGAGAGAFAFILVV